MWKCGNDNKEKYNFIFSAENEKYFFYANESKADVNEKKYSITISDTDFI